MLTVTVGPLSCSFTNRNRDMALQAHSHLAEVTVEFLAQDHPNSPGWPSFEDTNRVLGDLVRDTLAHPIVGTNEAVVQALWDALLPATQPLNPPTDPKVKVWHDAGCRWVLTAVTLAVRGVPDAIGHDDGWTRYTIREPWEQP